MRSYTMIGVIFSMIMFGACFSAHCAETGSDGQTKVNKAILKAKTDIERDTETLNTLRSRIAKERRTLANRLESLRKTVKKRRTKVEQIRRLRQQGEKEQAVLEAQAVAVEEECRFLQALFTEYARAMETRVGAAESVRLSEQLQPIQEGFTETETFEGFADATGNLLALSAASNLERLGGAIFDGVAIDANGIEHKGRFAAFGPIAYFADDDAGLAGMAVTKFGAVQPAIYERFSENVPPAIKKLVNGDPASVPVDVTSGDALKVKDAKPTLIEHLKAGGFVMLPLMLVAAAALLLIVWKSVELAGICVNKGGDLAKVINAVKSGNVEAATERMDHFKQPLRSLVEEAINHRGSSRSHLEEIMHEHILTLLPKLERNLGTLAVLGGIAPLMGLLGTVTGMIHTFQLVTIFGSGDAKLLSGGISEALVTTETGLAIAIPVLLAHSFLVRRSRSIIGALERTAIAIVKDLKTRGDTT